jgi:hypothetical protein
MGFITRRLVPRKVRRLAHPVRAAKRALYPKPLKKAINVVSVVRNPVSNAAYALERAVFTKSKSSSSKPLVSFYYKHGACTVKHKTPEAAARCRK